MSKQTIRFLAAVMALVGSLIVVVAAYSYSSQVRTEQALEAEVPGQNVNGAPTTTPIVLMPSNEEQSIPTAIALNVSPSVTPLPTQGATPVQPDATTAANLALTPTAIVLAPEATATLESSESGSTASSARGVPRGSGSPAVSLSIPKLNMVNLPIKPSEYITYQLNGQMVSDWNVPYDGAGHLVTTAQPGEIGNAILSGHHNLVGPNKFGLGKFAGLWNLGAGDEVRITTQDGKNQLWRVVQSFPIKEGGEPLAVRIQHAQQIMADTDKPTLTLLTCWNGKTNPLSGNTYRWVIQAELVSIN